MTIREGTESDLAAISAIAAATLDQDEGHTDEVSALLWRIDGSTNRIHLVAESAGRIEGFAAGTLHWDAAYLDVIAVSPDAQRGGVGRALIQEWERISRERGSTVLRAGASRTAYAWPGVDVRYTPAVCLLRQLGYETKRVAVNMDLALGPEMGPSVAALERITSRGIEVRRATAADTEELGDFIVQHWSEAWRREARISCEREFVTTFLAHRAGRIVGFASYGVYRSNWFGPTATAPEVRGTGIGEVLLRLCLQDLWEAGAPEVQIGWVDEALPFYSRVVGARSGRVFWQLEKDERNQE